MKFQHRIDNVTRLRAARIMYLDFETQSKCDLIKRGAFVYAQDPSTRVLVACYRFSDADIDDIQTWVPAEAPMPDDFAKHTEGGARGGLIHAWNAQFEYLILKHVLKLTTSIWQMSCTAAQARANALPGALGNCASALGANATKDARGGTLIALYSMPKEGGRLTPWADIPAEDQQAWKDYCRSDVLVESALGANIPALTDREVAEYQLTEVINARGMCVDLELAADILVLAKSVLSDVNNQINTLTEGIIEKSTSQKGRDRWLVTGYLIHDSDDQGDVEQVPEKWRVLDPEPDLSKIPKYLAPRLDEYAGVAPRMSLKQLAYLRKPQTPQEKEDDVLGAVTFDKRWRADLMAANSSDLVTLSPDVLEFFELLDEAGGATIAKYAAAQNRSVIVDGEAYVPGCYLFEGAGQTGRFSSMGLQTHNLRRVGLDNFEDVIDCVTVAAERIRTHAPSDTINGAIDEIRKVSGHSLMDTFAYLVRNMIVAPDGGRLVWGDWSSIEARVLPWLADSKSSREKLDKFAAGIDVYIANAATTFNIPESEVTKGQRQIGKVEELALGFGGGAGALNNMARAYGIKFTDEEALAYRDGWREANPWAPVFWKEVEMAVWAAIYKPMRPFSAGRLTYQFYPDIMGGTLFCALPSGRYLSYPGVRVETVFNEHFDSEVQVLTSIAGSMKKKVGDPEWPRKKLWAGTFVENATQGLAADILREAIIRVEGPNTEVVATTHDEIVIEVDDTGDPERWVAWLEKEMNVLPNWAEGLPLAVEGDYGYCYTK